jgi:hypothetical protein
LRGTERPALGENQIVDVLQADASQLAENVQRVKDVLQIHQADIPLIAAALNDRLKSESRTAVAAARVKIDKIEVRYRTVQAGKMPNGRNVSMRYAHEKVLRTGLMPGMADLDRQLEG